MSGFARRDLYCKIHNNPALSVSNISASANCLIITLAEVRRRAIANAHTFDPRHPDCAAASPTLTVEESAGDGTKRNARRLHLVPNPLHIPPGLNWKPLHEVLWNTGAYTISKLRQTLNLSGLPGAPRITSVFPSVLR